VGQVQFLHETAPFILRDFLADFKESAAATEKALVREKVVLHGKISALDLTVHPGLDSVLGLVLPQHADDDGESKTDQKDRQCRENGVFPRGGRRC
jgi:hypothetical protein